MPLILNALETDNQGNKLVLEVAVGLRLVGAAEKKIDTRLATFG